MRHRKILRDTSPPPKKKQKRSFGSTAKKAGSLGDEIEADEVVEEDEDSDEDMGFGLFDGDTPPATPAVASASAHAPAVAASYLGPEKKTDVDEGSILQRLTKKQSFEGSWTNDDLPCDAMGVQRHPASVVIEKLVVAYPGLDRERIGKLFATAIAVIFLEKKLIDQEDTWELMVEKAKEWLDEAVPGEMLAELWKEAQALIGVV